MDRHIITIEDPIEYYHKHQEVLVTSERSASTCPTFPRPCGGPCGWTRTSSWWARCATWTPSRRPSPRPRPGTSSSAPCTRTRPKVRSTDHRRVPPGAAGPDPHPAVHGDHRHPRADPPARNPRAWWPPTSAWSSRPPSQPDPREQDLPHRFDHSDRPQVRHDPAGRLACSTSGGRGSSTRRSRTSSPARSRTPRPDRDWPRRASLRTTTRRRTTIDRVNKSGRAVVTSRRQARSTGGVFVFGMAFPSCNTRLM